MKSIKKWLCNFSFLLFSIFIQTESFALSPKYKSCKDVDISSSEDGTGFEEVKNINLTTHSKAFKEKLQEQVKGAILTKIYQTKLLHACTTENKELLKEMKIDWEAIKEECRQKSKELKSSIKSRWPEMRVRLALSDPPIKENRILADRATWFDPTPSHYVSDFSDLPQLTEKERERAEDIYLNALAEVPLESMSSLELTQKLKEKEYIHVLAKKPLTGKDHSRLRQTASSLRGEARESYSEIVSEMPLLGYLKTDEPNKREFKEAFTKITKRLESFLEKAEQPDVDMALLLSFKPLVEKLLKNNKEYCLVAEKLRIQAEEDKSFENWAMLGAGVIAGLPCLISGPIGQSFCLSFGIGLGVLGIKEVKVAKREALGHVLTGEGSETIASLEDKEKEELLAKLFLPLGAWGTTAVPAKAVSRSLTKWARKQKHIDEALRKERQRRDEALRKERQRRMDEVREQLLKDGGTPAYESLRKDLMLKFGKLETTPIQRWLSNKDLKIPKKIKEEAKLKAKGFTSADIEGLDEMTETIAIAKQLRNLEMDPYTTHIDYFADKIKEHVRFMERGIENFDFNQRAKMTVLKGHIDKAIKEKKFTYEKWIRYNEMLPKAISPGNKYSIRNTKVTDDLIRRFPETVLMPTTKGESGIITMNEGMDNNVYVLGLTNKKVIVFDGATDTSDNFFAHDLLHTKIILESITNQDGRRKFWDAMKRARTKKIKEFPPEKRKNIEYVYWTLKHELLSSYLHSGETMENYIDRGMLSRFFKNDREKSRKAIDDFMEFYNSIPKDEID